MIQHHHIDRASGSGHLKLQARVPEDPSKDEWVLVQSGTSNAVAGKQKSRISPIILICRLYHPESIDNDLLAGKVKFVHQSRENAA